MLLRLCAEAGFAPRSGPRTANYATAQGLVAAGLGVALVPGLALDYPRSDVVARPLRTRPVRTVFAAAASRAPAPAGVTALVDLLRRQLRARRATR
jgi:DNA-binding transcriptional LysR family regulator